jgi:hypothetical protein
LQIRHDHPLKELHFVYKFFIQNSIKKYPLIFFLLKIFFSATNNQLKVLLEKTQNWQGGENFAEPENAKIDLVESALRSFVAEVSLAQNSLIETQAGLAENKVLVSSLSPMVDAVSKVKLSKDKKQVAFSVRELKKACRVARNNFTTFESSFLSGVAR